MTHYGIMSSSLDPSNMYINLHTLIRKNIENAKERQTSTVSYKKKVCLFLSYDEKKIVIPSCAHALPFHQDGLAMASVVPDATKQNDSWKKII